jgi:hypothetical protein
MKFALTIIGGLIVALAGNVMLASHQRERPALPRPRPVLAHAPDAGVRRDAGTDVPAVLHRRRRPFWCEFTNTSVRGWRGVALTLPDGRVLRYIAVPGEGLVSEVPDTAAPAYREWVERTEWGYGGDGGVRVGIAATIDGARYCYEWREPNVVRVPCRMGEP